ncbi:MAG: prepilin peptidase, partial [Syntrophobacteraceae bacterium]
MNELLVASIPQVGGQIAAFLAGAVFGSFYNVVIHRLPLGQSIVRPASRCPGCGEAIAPYDNIPVASFLFLGGKCRHCKSPISLRYPLVEAISG